MTQNSKLHSMILIAIFASITGILAQLTIPLPLVPITGQTLAIGLMATILGAKKSTYSVLLYCLMGIVGIPVFANMSSGITVLFGPTGGFIVGFIPTAFFIGYFLEKTSYTVTNAFIANIIGMFITLIFGTIWLIISAKLSFAVGMSSGFLPFIIPGIIKAYMAALVGITVRSRLYKAKLLPA